MDPIILRINREGSFTVTDIAEHPVQCGKIGARAYKYFVSIEATNHHLTPEGYVMENAWCDEYFRERYEQKVMSGESCERMSSDAIEHFRRLFAEHPDLRRVELRRILVRLHGSPVSFIEAEWRKEQ